MGRLRSTIELDRLSAILISHMHPDHIFDLVPLAYGFTFGSLPPIPLLLPPEGYPVLEALQSAVGLSETFFADVFDVSSYDPKKQTEISGIAVDFAPTRHYIPAYAMRLTIPAGRCLVYSSDTGRTDEVVGLMRDASLAIVEASLLEYHSENEAYGHLTPELAGQMAREAGVQRLLLTHYADRNAEKTRLEASEAFGKPAALAREGETHTV